MRIISEHTESPFHFYCPPYYTVKSSWIDSKGEFSLYLDINKADQLLNLHYTVSGGDHFWVPYLSYMAEAMSNKSIAEVEAWDSNQLREFLPLKGEESPFLFAPIATLLHALKEFKGNILPHDKQLKFPSENLICRCFGVYRDEIEALVLKKPDADLRDVTDELRAGGGCATCGKSIKDVLLRTRDRLGVVSVHSKLDKHGKYLRLQGMTPAKFILKVDALIQNWLREQNAVDQFSVEIQALEGYTLKLLIEPKEKAEILMGTLKEILDPKLDVSLTLAIV